MNYAILTCEKKKRYTRFMIVVYQYFSNTQLSLNGMIPNVQGILFFLLCI